jgi:hypothetical protein
MPEFSFPTDTSRDAFRKQLEIVRRMTPAERLARLDALTAFARNLTLTGIRRTHPDATEAQVLEIFFRLRLGRDLADRVLAARARRADAAGGAERPSAP